MIGQAAQRSDRRGFCPATRELIGDARGRSAVRLGKDHVEGDHRSSGLTQPVGQPGNIGARPWPLAKPANAFIVDIDHPDRGILIDARRGPFIAVEQQQAEPVERGQAKHMKQRHQRHQPDPGQHCPAAARALLNLFGH